MSSRVKLLIVGFIGFIGLILILFMMFAAWSAIYFGGLDGMTKCQEIVQKDMPSPGGHVHALVAVQNCGATVDDVVKIYVSSSSSFSVAEESIKRALVYSTPNIYNISVLWRRENSLEIKDPDGTGKDYSSNLLDEIIDVHIVTK
jgi:hypothetical protein